MNNNGTSGNGCIYTSDYRLVIDRGGQDIFQNNAGGSGGLAGALIELEGDHTYMSSPTCTLDAASHPVNCRAKGINGGAFASSRGAGAGFLFDAGEGNNTYAAGNDGVNGGAEVEITTSSAGDGTSTGYSTGFLFDKGGNDKYSGADKGTNGGGLAPGALGPAAATGLLLDTAGDDKYTAGNTATNGGGYGGARIRGTCSCAAGLGVGLLADMAGNDSYGAGSLATNGGGFGGSTLGYGEGDGFLSDLSGNDSYTAGDNGTNGGGFGGDDLREPYPSGNGTQQALNRTGVGAGFLSDAAGDDVYTAGRSGTNGGGYGAALTGYGAGNGLLLDEAGNDIYRGGDQGTNGGGFGDRLAAGSGLLMEASGNDSYVAGQSGTNGGGDRSALSTEGRLSGGSATQTAPAGLGNGTGLLFDNGGDDGYVDPVSSADPKAKGGGECRNCTIVPKPAAGQGAQVDEPAALDPTVSIADSSTASSGNKITFKLSLDHPALQTATVDYQTSDGDPAADTDPNQPAKAGEDYKESRAKVTFNPGDTEKTITVSVIPDTKPDFNEYFFVTLSNPSGLSLSEANHRAKGTIVNDNGIGIFINDVSHPEGDSATTPFSFTLSLNRASDQPVTVDYVTKDGTATAPQDYSPAGPATLTFPPGQTTQTITVGVNGDTTYEGDEDFSVQLSNSSGATIGAGTGKGTIVNDDGLSVNDVSVKEGDSGATDAAFKVSLNAPAPHPLSVKYATEDGAATSADNDYQPTQGTVSFSTGETQKQVVVKVNGDTKPEPDEDFFLKLFGTNPKNVPIVSGRGRAIIVNDDSGISAPTTDVFNTASISDLSTVRPAVDTEVSLKVTLYRPSVNTVSVDYATADDSAVAPQDYKATSGTLEFAPGQTEGLVKVIIRAQQTTSPTKTFKVLLSRPVNVNIFDGEGLVTIYNRSAEIADSYSYTDGTRSAGGVWVSGHDAEGHAGDAFPVARNRPAEHIIQRALAYVTHGKPNPRLLYVANASPQEGGDHRGVLGMNAAGFAGFDLARAGGGVGYRDLGSVDFSQYDVVVIGCATECQLLQADMDVLNARADDIVNYVNGTGGLVAFNEGDGDPLDPERNLSGQYGFLPFLRSSAGASQYETGSSTTSFGKSVGLTDTDVSTNYAHNIFTDPSGFGIVDVDSQGRILELATRKLIGSKGAIDEKGKEGVAPKTENNEPPRGPDAAVPQAGGQRLPGRAAPLSQQQPSPPNQPSARVDQAGLGRSANQATSQTTSQAQPASQSQAQSQAQNQAQQASQTQSQVQVQAAAAPMVEAAPQVQHQVEHVRDTERKDSFHSSGRSPQKDTGNLASALSHSGALQTLGFGGFAVLSALMFALSKPKKRSSPLHGLAYEKHRPMLRAGRPAPRHRRC